MPTGGVPQNSSLSKTDLAWYHEKVAAWKDLAWIEVRDDPGFRAAVLDVVARRLPGPEVNEEALSDSVAAHLLALAAPNPQEYLARIAGERELRRGLDRDSHVATCHEVAFSEPIPSGITAADLLDKFWRRADATAGTLKRVSSRSLMQVDWGIVPADRSKRKSLHFSDVAPRYPMFRTNQQEALQFAGGFSGSFPMVTQPAMALSDLLEKEDRLLCAILFLIVETKRNVQFSVEMDYYYSPSEGRWHLQQIAHYYPYDICWPY